MWGYKITPTAQSSEIVVEATFKVWNWHELARRMIKLGEVEE